MATKKDEDKYFNFPVVLLKNAFNDIGFTMSNIMDYAGFVHTLKFEFGNEQDLMKAAGGFFGITYGDPKANYKAGKMIYENLEEKAPMTGINKDVCFDFYKNEKTPDEIAVLLAFLAVKSIVGNKAYVKTSNEFIIARMGGYSSIKDVPKQMPKMLEKYSTRRRLQRIKTDLQISWFVNIYSKKTMRGMYVSLESTFTLEKLIDTAEKNSMKYREKLLQMRKKEILEKLKIE